MLVNDFAPAGDRPTYYTLAAWADVATPDGEDSPGARFLRDVYDSALEKFQYLVDGEEAEDFCLYEPDDTAHEVADEAPSLGTHERMSQLVDLCAYYEDVSNFTHGQDSMVELAGYALYLVAHRLALQLLQGWAEEVETMAERGLATDDEEVLV